VIAPKATSAAIFPPVTILSGTFKSHAPKSHDANATILLEPKPQER
jgi:hypothetical protein